MARFLHDYCLLPSLFWLWANLHGTFAIGVLVFTIFVALQYVPYTRQVGPAPQLRRLSISYVCSVLATFLNPFGYGVYLEALRHAHHPLLQYVLEWIPVQFPSGFYLLFLSYTLIVAALLAIALAQLPIGLAAPPEPMPSADEVLFTRSKANVFLAVTATASSLKPRFYARSKKTRSTANNARWNSNANC